MIMFLSGIKGEFTKHLEENYPDLSFKIGSTKIDLIYGKYYAEVSCLNDGTSFPITKSFNTKEISEDYLYNKSRNQYNSTIQNVFKGSDIEDYMKSVTGGGEKLFDKDRTYNQIYIYLTDDAEHIKVVKNAVDILIENKIDTEKVIFTYEKDKHVYELWLTPEEYVLSEKELTEKVRKIK